MIRSSGTTGSSQSRTDRAFTSRCSSRSRILPATVTPSVRLPRSRYPLSRLTTFCFLPDVGRAAAVLQLVQFSEHRGDDVNHVLGGADGRGVLLDSRIAQQSIGIGHDAHHRVSTVGGHVEQFAEDSQFASGDYLRLIDCLRDGVVEASVPVDPSAEELVGRSDLAFHIRRGVRKQQPEPLEPA